MIFTIGGGTDRQQQLVHDAIANCSFDLGFVDAVVAVTWGSAPSSDTSHPYMVTTPNADGSFTVTIEPWADDPTYPENQGMPDPHGNIDQFYRESFIHELGHVISDLTFATSQATIAQMCGLFWTAQIGAAGGMRRGTAVDFNPGADWGMLIIEAVAEVFKCTFCTTPRVFENRTLWHLDAADFSQFLQLLSIRSNIASIAWAASSATVGRAESGVFDIEGFFGTPLVVENMYIATTMTIHADFKFQDNQATPTVPDEISENSFAIASWNDDNVLPPRNPTQNRSWGDSQTQFVSGPGSYDLLFDYSEELSFGRFPIRLLETLWQIQAVSPHAYFANHRYDVTYLVQVFDNDFVPGDWIQITKSLGYDDVSFVPFFFVNLSGHINGATRNAQLFGAFGSFLAGWAAWSDNGSFNIRPLPEGFAAVGSYPFVPRVGSIDVTQSLRGALPASNGIHGRAPAAGPGGFVGNPNPPHIVLQLTDTQKQSTRQRGATGANGLRGALVP